VYLVFVDIYFQLLSHFLCWTYAAVGHPGVFSAWNGCECLQYEWYDRQLEPPWGSGVGQRHSAGKFHQDRGAMHGYHVVICCS